MKIGMIGPMSSNWHYVVQWGQKCIEKKDFKKI